MEAERDEAARRVEEAKVELRSKNALLANWNAALTDYQIKSGLLAKVSYSQLKPSERLDHWASTHDGVVVIRDLASELVEVGAI